MAVEKIGDREIDGELMNKCDEFLSARVDERGMPHDFDDVTWVMHDFVRWLRASQGERNDD